MGLIGVYEYHLYPSEKKQQAKYTAKLYLLGLLSMILVGIGGFVAMYMGVTFSLAWPGFLVMTVVALFLLVLQRRLHNKMDLSSSPIQQKVMSTLEEDELDEETIMEEMGVPIDEEETVVAQAEADAAEFEEGTDHNN